MAILIRPIVTEKMTAITELSSQARKKKDGSWFSYGDSKLAQGRDAVKKLIEDNPELADELSAKITDALENSEQ